MADRRASVEFGPFRLDVAKRVMWRGGELVSLPPKALDLLVALVEQRGDVVPKEELLRRVWPDTFVEEANLSVNVSTLRKALGNQASGTPYIETVPRRGYRFAAETSAPDGSTAPRLAVLPFRMLGGEAEDAYLGVAMADAVITRLSRIGEIAVRPTSAVLAYSDRAAALEQIGRELRVDAVLDGRLQPADTRIRVTVQLVRVESSETSWAESFDVELTDLLGLQDAVAEHRRALELAEGASFMRCVLARSLALAGEAGEARRFLAELAAGESGQHASPYQRATVHLVLSERERALELLAQACEARDPWVILLGVDPMLDELRDSPRFEELVKRVFA